MSDRMIQNRSEYDVLAQGFVRISPFYENCPGQRQMYFICNEAGLDMWDHKENALAVATNRGWAVFQRVEFIAHDCDIHPWVACPRTPVKYTHAWGSRGIAR